MDFESLLRAAFNQFVKRIVKLILFSLVGGLLCLTIVLIPTVAAGLTRGMIRYVRDDIEPEFDELWRFDGYLQTLLLLVLGGIAISIGLALLIVPGVVLAVWWMYAFFLMADRRMTFAQAMRASRQLVTSTGFWNHFVVLLIMAVLNSVGGGMAGLGTLLTAPFALLLATNVYLGATQQNVAAKQAGPSV